MKKRDVINTVLLISILMYSLIYKTVIITKFLKYEGIITSLFFIIVSFSTYLLLGYKNTKKNIQRKKITNYFVYTLILFFLFYYSSGFLFGFQHSPYSHRIFIMLGNIINPFIIIVASEIIRNIIVNANKDKKYIIVIITACLFIIDSLQTINYYDLTDKSELFKYIACNVLPLLVKHSMLSYLAYYTGSENTILYRLTTELYIFIVPIIPNLGEYLNSVIDLVLPFIIYSFTNKVITKNDYVEVNYKIRKFKFSDAIFLIIFIAVLSLVGGVFNHKMLAIASDSMTPIISRGDAVIIEKYEQNKEYRINDIISFDFNGRTIVHRIDSIEMIDGIKYYHTKGDNNPIEDSILLPEYNIHGKVISRIKYIGYPAVYINEVRSKHNE